MLYRCQGGNITCYTVAAKNYSAIGNDRRLIRQNAGKIAVRIRLTNVRYLCIFKIQLSLLSDLNRRMRILRPRYNHLFVYDPCFLKIMFSTDHSPDRRLYWLKDDRSGPIRKRQRPPRQSLHIYATLSIAKCSMTRVRFIIP